jgi:glycosyltransferase involved in cell wall biosynthesis
MQGMPESTLNISVIITTYNRCRLLRRALVSVLKQRRRPEQIIIVDDGSGDGTKKLIQNEFSEIEYIYQENSGISAARNRGILAAQHPWIAFLDSDDAWMADKLADQEAALIQAPAARICHTDEIWIRRGLRVNQKNKHRKYGGHIYDYCLPLCVISPSAVLIHRELFEYNGLFDEKMPVCEDYDMWLRICAQNRVLYLDKKLVIKYGGHADQLSRKYWGMDRFRIYSLEKILGSGVLNKAQQWATLYELEKKLKIYITGAQKRDKNSDISFYSKKYTQTVNRLQEIESQSR